MKKSKLIIPSLVFALFGCLTQADTAAPLSTASSPLNKISLCPTLSSESGPALSPTLFSSGQKLKQKTAKVSSHILATYSPKLLTSGRYQSKLPQNFINLPDSPYLEKATATLHQATLATLNGYERPTNYWQRPQNYTNMRKLKPCEIKSPCVLEPLPNLRPVNS